MAWALPRTWVASEVVTAAMVNAHLRDNQLVLKTTRDAAGRIAAISSAEFGNLDGSNLTGVARLGSDMPAPSAWYRAHTIALSNGSAVSTWLDDSGNGRDLTQGTGAQQPVYHTNAVSSGFPAVYFDGTLKRLVSAVNLSAFLGANGVGSIFVVFRVDVDPAGSDVLVFGGLTNFSGLYWTGGNLLALNYDGTQDQASKAAATVTWHVGGWLHDASSVYVDVDNADSLVSAATGTTADLAGPVTAGSDGTNHLKGYIAEIIVFNVALTQEQARRVHLYLKTKYGTTDGTAAPVWAGNAYTAGNHKFTSASRVRVPVGRDKWETTGVGARRGVWVEGDYVHHISSDGTTERRYLGAVVSTPPGALAGSLWVEGDWLHYISATGVERRCQSVGNASPHVDSFALGGSAWVETYVHWVSEAGSTEMPGHGDFHSDGTVHNDTHGDVAHTDSHSDVGHADSHGDGAHTDTAHSDFHGDSHLDLFDDFHQDHHGDSHGDQSHQDAAHTDSHTDASHSDSHSDVSHSDSHSDHTDHGDVAHADAPEVVSA